MPRPRRLPEKQALEKALQVFWTKGYDRSSLGDLGAALGVGPSSIYNAFGSKAELFRRSLEHYVETHTIFLGKALKEVDQKGADQTLRELLRSAVNMYVEESTPLGCAVMQGGGGGGSKDSEGGEIAKEFRQKLHKVLLTLLKSADEKDLQASPILLAKFLIANIRGLSQLACDGTSRKQLHQIADHAVSSCFRT